MKDGTIYKNVLITEKTDYSLLFKYNGSIVGVQVYNVLKIDDVTYDPNLTSSLTVNGIIVTDPIPFKPNEPKTEMPNLNLLFVSALSCICNA